MSGTSAPRGRLPSAWTTRSTHPTLGGFVVGQRRSRAPMIVVGKHDAGAPGGR